MAAGLGFKDFVTGEVLTAADVDGYLMQGVWVFASAAARDAAVTSPQEGNFAYLKDTNVTTYYTGSAWANLDTTGMTNPMTTTGDTIYSSSGSTPARLGIGSTGQVLTVAGGVPSWATPAGGGGKVLQVVQGTKLDTASTTSTTFTASGVSISITPTSATSKVLIISQVNIGSDAVSYPYISLYRAGSAIFQGDTAGNRPRVTSAAITTNANFIVTVPVTYLDSPATTSATTYELYFRSSEGQTVWINKSNTDNNATTYSPRGASSIIALEIGA